MTFELLQTILEFNKIGELQKLDPFTETASRAKYARVCVKIKYTPNPKDYVVLPNFKNAKEKRRLKVWYEGVSEGCINCVERGHTFHDCPQRVMLDRNVKATLDKLKTKGKQVDEAGGNKAEVNEDDDEGWTKVADRKGKKPMEASSYRSLKHKFRPRAGKSLRIYDMEKNQERKNNGGVPDRGGETKMGKSNSDGDNDDAVVPNITTTADLVAPNNMTVVQTFNPQEQEYRFPQANMEMMGMDQSIFDFCGNLPLGTIQEEGRYLLQDVVQECNNIKNQAIIIPVDEATEDTDPSSNSTHSRSSMIHKLNNMTVHKEEISMSDSAKRKSGDGEEDMASSAAKRPRNVDP